MKKKIFLIIFILIVILGIFSNKKDFEKVVVKYAKEEPTNKDYQVYMNDDCIYFHDEKGNAVIYNFSGEKISEAFLLISVNSFEEAKQVKDFYMQSLASGDVEEIITEDDLVTIVYNDEYIHHLSEYTKADIEAMLYSE